jgi:peroxiredoxin
MKNVSSWVRPLLVGGALLNLILAVFLILIPQGSHRVLFGGAPFLPPQAIQVWGILLASLGVGYAVVGLKPLNNTVVLLMGLLANLLFALVIPTVADGFFLQHTAMVVWVLIALLWVGVLGAVLNQIAQVRKTSRSRSRTNRYQEPVSQTLSRFRTQRGKSLLQLSNEQPTLLVFLRPFTSSSCRELLEEISRQRNEIERQGSQIVLVHVADLPEARAALHEWALTDLHHISDPNGSVYKAFGLKSSGSGLFTWIKSWFRSKGTTMPESQSSAYHQPKGYPKAGVFLISNGEIVRSYRPSYVSPKPNYRQWVAEQAA